MTEIEENMSNWQSDYTHPEVEPWVEPSPTSAGTCSGVGQLAVIRGEPEVSDMADTSLHLLDDDYSYSAHQDRGGLEDQ